MKVILDTNVLISALLVPSGAPGAIYRAWADGAFTLPISEEQLYELRRTLAKPALAARIRPPSRREFGQYTPTPPITSGRSHT